MEASLHCSRPVRNSASVAADRFPIRVKCATVKNSNGISEVFIRVLPPAGSVPRLLLRVLASEIARGFFWSSPPKRARRGAPPQRQARPRDRRRKKRPARREKRASPETPARRRLCPGCAAAALRRREDFQEVAAPRGTDRGMCAPAGARGAARQASRSEDARKSSFAWVRSTLPDKRTAPSRAERACETSIRAPKQRAAFCRRAPIRRGPGTAVSECPRNASARRAAGR